jgi:hypothetical protein
MNFSTEAAPGNATLTDALGYISIDCNDTSALQFPITLKIYYNDSEVAAQGYDPDFLGIWYLNQYNSWVFVGGVVNKTEHSVTVTLTHFSTYALAKAPTNTDLHTYAVIFGVLAMSVLGLVAVVKYEQTRNPNLFPDLKARIKRKVARQKRTDSP